MIFVEIHRDNKKWFEILEEYTLKIFNQKDTSLLFLRVKDEADFEKKLEQKISAYNKKDIDEHLKVKVFKFKPYWHLKGYNGW